MTLYLKVCGSFLYRSFITFWTPLVCVDFRLLGAAAAAICVVRRRRR